MSRENDMVEAEVNEGVDEKETEQERGGAGTYTLVRQSIYMPPRHDLKEGAT